MGSSPAAASVAPPPPVPFGRPIARAETADEREAKARAQDKYQAGCAANEAALADLVRSLPDNVLAKLLREVSKVPLEAALFALGR